MTRLAWQAGEDGALGLRCKRDALPDLRHREHTGFPVLRWLWRQARPRNKSRRADREDLRRRTVSAAALSDTGASAELREWTDVARATRVRTAGTGEHSTTPCEHPAGERTREHPADERTREHPATERVSPGTGEHSAEHVSRAGCCTPRGHG